MREDLPCCLEGAEAPPGRNPFPTTSVAWGGGGVLLQAPAASSAPKAGAHARVARRSRLGLRVAPCALAASLFALLSGFALDASADEPRSATEPRVMQEAGEVVEVIDAFDDGDVFDLNISLGFTY